MTYFLPNQHISHFLLASGIPQDLLFAAWIVLQSFLQDATLNLGNIIPSNALLSSNYETGTISKESCVSITRGGSAIIKQLRCNPDLAEMIKSADCHDHHLHFITSRSIPWSLHAAWWGDQWVQAVFSHKTAREIDTRHHLKWSMNWLCLTINARIGVRQNRHESSTQCTALCVTF